MTNNLSAFVWVQLEVDCTELQGSSPLSHVLPPHSQNTLLLMFQSNKLGRFYRLILKAVLQKKKKKIIQIKLFVLSPVLTYFFSLQNHLLLCKPETLWTDSGSGPRCPISSGAIYDSAGALPHFLYACKVWIQELRNYSKPAQPCCRVLMEDSSHRKWQSVYSSTNYRYWICSTVLCLLLNISLSGLLFWNS